MIVVTGATGSVGREVVSQLSELGHAVRAVTRDPGTATLPTGAQAVRGDLADPASIAGHVRDAEAVLLVWPFTAPELTARLAAAGRGASRPAAAHRLHLGAAGRG